MGQQLLPLEQLGGPARALRAFRRLLFLEGPELEGSPLLKELPRPEVRGDCDHSLCLQVPHCRCCNAGGIVRGEASYCSLSNSRPLTLHINTWACRCCTICTPAHLPPSSRRMCGAASHPHRCRPLRLLPAPCLIKICLTVCQNTHLLASHSGCHSLFRPFSPCLPSQYSLWLDGHSQEETLKFIRTALEACTAKAKGAEGAEQLLPLMRRLAARG